MASERWTKLSLRVVSDRLTTSEIEHAVQVEPTVRMKIGEPVSLRSPQAGAHRQNVCIFESPLSPDTTVDGQIDWVVGFLSEHAPSFDSIADRCEVDIRLGFSSGSEQAAFALPARVLRILARFGADLFVDLYASDDGD